MVDPEIHINIIGSKWFTWPVKPDYYTLRYGGYLPSISDISGHYGNYSIKELKQIQESFMLTASLDPRGYQLSKICALNDDIDINCVWPLLSKLFPKKNQEKLEDFFYPLCSGVFTSVQNLNFNKYNKKSINEVIQAIEKIYNFIENDLHSFQAFFNINNVGGDGIYFVSDHIQDIKDVCLAFGFDGSKTSNNSTIKNNQIMQDEHSFISMVDEYFPTLPMMLKNLSEYLSQVSNLNPVIKQEKSNLKELQAYCRLLSAEFKKVCGRPCYNIVSIVSNFIFKNHFEIDISEEYVKQTCRTKINTAPFKTSKK